MHQCHQTLMEFFLKLQYLFLKWVPKGHQNIGGFLRFCPISIEFCDGKIKNIAKKLGICNILDMEMC